MYVILYQPERSESELFGPYEDPIKATQALRNLATKAGTRIEGPGAGLMAGVVVTIDGERHRYQLLKVGSPVQLEAHGDVIEALADESTVEAAEAEPPAAPSILSGY